MAQLIQFKSIGVVHNGITEAHRDLPWREIESTVVVDAEWHDALDGLDQFSHVWIIFCFDRIAPATTTRTYPLHGADLPLVGRFATRSPERPNPIGTSSVELLEVCGATLRVRGLDALEGSPVLDIKPYLPRRDAIENTHVGDWVKRSRGTK